MKTISGKLVSSKPISLSKASKIISGFTAVDNGASHAISVYLNRASEAFDRLVQFHKDLKAPPKKNEDSIKIEPHQDEEKVQISEKKRNSAKHDGEKVKKVKEKGENEVLKVEQTPESENLKRVKNKGLNAVQDGESAEKGAESQSAVKVENNLDVNLVETKKTHKKRQKQKNEGEEKPTEEYSEKSRNMDEQSVKDDCSIKIEENRDGVEIDGEKKRNKKKRKMKSEDEIGDAKSLDVHIGAEVGSLEQNSKKKRKKRKIEGDN